MSSYQHVRLIERGFEKYTGMLGDIEFQDGVSVERLGRMQIDRIASAMRCESHDGVQLGAAARLVQGKHMGAPNVNSHQVAVKAPDAMESHPVKAEDPESPEPSTNAKFYTRDQLEVIADAKGILGLRQIAEPLGVKARSVNELMDEIVKAQGA